MAGKRARDADVENPAPQSTPKKLRFGEPAASTPTKGTPTKSALKKTVTNGTPRGSKGTDETTVTPSNRSSKKAVSYSTPTNGVNRKRSAINPTVQNADRSARRKKNRSLIERNLAGGQSDEEQDDVGEDRDEDEEDEEADSNQIVLPTTETATEGDAQDPQATTPSKRGRGRPPGAKNKRTPTPPPDLPPHEWYFFQNRPAAAKHSSSTANTVPLMTHGAYFAAIRRHDTALATSEAVDDGINVDNDPAHAASIEGLHDLHAASFAQWAFELREGYSVVLHGYGSKRRLVRSFAEYLYSHSAPNSVVAVLASAHHPAFMLRSLLQTLARALGLEPADLPAAPAALLETLETHLVSDPKGPRVYVLLRTLTSRQAATPAAVAALAALAAQPRIGLLLTADNPMFPLLWPSAARDALNAVFHDATTFLPYDSTDPDVDENEGAGGEISELGTGAVDAVAELMSRRGAEIAGIERVRWVLQSLPENARGLYRIIVSEILAAADADDGGETIGFLDDEDEMDFGESNAKGKKGKNAKGTALEEMPAVDSKMVYQKASEEFLCSSEMAFRGLLREFLDHAMVVVRRDGVGGSGGEMLGVEMGRAELEGVLEDLVM